jgi:hypothetical protein
MTEKEIETRREGEWREGGREKAEGERWMERRREQRARKKKGLKSRLVEGGKK